MANYRNRPFLVISYRFTLDGTQKSNVPGFSETAKWAPIENMTIVDRITNRMLQEAEVIIDIFENTVIKNRGAADVENAQVMTHFVGKYAKDIKEALKTWIKNNPANLTKVQAFIEQFAPKAEEPADEAGE
jgi:hypothetical protein